MRLSELFDVEALKDHIKAGNVAFRTHPELPLKILTYTPQAQYAQAWDEVTTQTRGLIINSDADAPIAGNDLVIAVPFPKFFNYSEHIAEKPYAKPLPHVPFKVFEKVDGSLGIIYHFSGQWHAASKGSFQSEQAVWAQEYLRRVGTEDLVPGNTYLAEIIYPANRIVVDYGDREELVLLGVRCGNYDFDLTDQTWRWRKLGKTAYRYPPLPLNELVDLTQRNAPIDDYMMSSSVGVSGTEQEGFVLVWEGGLRCKIKYADYVSLHSYMTGLRTVDVWKMFGLQLFKEKTASTDKEICSTLGWTAEEIRAMHLETGGEDGAFDAFLGAIPDEVYDVVQELADQYAVRAAALHDTLEELFEARPVELLETRADFAKWAQAASAGLSPGIKAALFLLYDGNTDKLVRHVWKMVKPDSKPVFKAGEEE